MKGTLEQLDDVCLNLQRRGPAALDKELLEVIRILKEHLVSTSQGDSVQPAFGRR